MPSPRRKAPRQLAPQTIEEATLRAADYADLLLRVEELRADADASIAAIQAERDRMIAPMEQRAKDLFLQLRAWWGVAGNELTEGKKKSIELAGCQIGVRLTPPSLKMPAGAEESAQLLIDGGWGELTRTKPSVDKPAVLKVLAAEPELAFLHETAANEPARLLVEELTARVETIRALGFSAIQKDEFFIDRAGQKPAPTQEVADPAAEASAGE